MKLSTRATYGLRLCFMLAIAKAPLSASRLVKRTDIGIKYLEQLMSMLRRGNIVTAFRGKTGGYVLSREPQEITLKEILVALDDGFDAPSCISGSCEDMYCPNRNVLNKLNDGINGVLESVTLADMVIDCRNGCGDSK
ncbi:MAG: Rrf2 family transcriptional regulator [Clostridiales bacterium]|nr:Rrf2 family transcriptional regulator [Clostridiales bacterium]